MLKIKDLSQYNKMEKEIISRGKEIAHHLNLTNQDSEVVVKAGKTGVLIEVYDNGLNTDCIYIPLIIFTAKDYLKGAQNTLITKRVLESAYQKTA